MVDITDEWGAVIARDRGDEEERRWFFDRTDEGRLVFCAEVLHYTEDYGAMVEEAGRHYVDENNMEVPVEVVEALDEEGFDTEIVDLKGRKL